MTLIKLTNFEPILSDEVRPLLFVFAILRCPATNLEQKTTRVQGIGRCLPVGKHISKICLCRARGHYAKLTTLIEDLYRLLTWGLYCIHGSKKTVKV